MGNAVAEQPEHGLPRLRHRPESCCQCPVASAVAQHASREDGRRATGVARPRAAIAARQRPASGLELRVLQGMNVMLDDDMFTTLTSTTTATTITTTITTTSNDEYYYYYYYHLTTTTTTTYYLRLLLPNYYYLTTTTKLLLRLRLLLPPNN